MRNPLRSYNYNSDETKQFVSERVLVKRPDRIWLHVLLFVATFITCTIAGTQWQMKDFAEIANWHYGITYAILILTFLSAHEFGHYFASKIHKVDATLPYFIPSPFPEVYFGTFGAVIKTRSPMGSKNALFDIGVAGPISGFIVCIVFLIIGLETLPPMEYIYTIHPNYLLNGGLVSTKGLYFGDTLLYLGMSKVFINANGWLPPMNEIYHYPFLCVGWFGLFVTSLNLLPIGQLDGGHIIYSMFGNIQKRIARIFWWLMIIIGLGAVFNLLATVLTNYDLPYSAYIGLQNKLLPFLEWFQTQVPGTTTLGEAGFSGL